jgi:hypothetical protein
MLKLIAAPKTYILTKMLNVVNLHAVSRSFVVSKLKLSGGLQDKGKDLFREYSLCDKFIKLKEWQTLLFPSALVEWSSRAYSRGGLSFLIPAVSICPHGKYDR